jgi:hypothetical protein
MKKLFKVAFLCATMVAASLAMSCGGEDTPPVTPDPPVTEEKPEYNISFAALENGTAVALVDGEEVTKAKAGDIITVEATPADTFHFAGWSSEPSTGFDDIAAETTNFLMPAEDITITALFSKDSYMLSFTAEPAEGGSVVVVIDGTAITSGDLVELGTEVAAQVTVNPGYVFTGWDGVELDNATDMQVTFSMPAEAVNLKAVFEKAKHTLNFSANPVEGGTVTITVDGAPVESGTVLEVGTACDMKVTVNVGYAFDGYEGFIPDETFSLVEDFEMPDQEVNIVAKFVPVDTYAIKFGTMQNGYFEARVNGELIESGDKFEFNTFVELKAFPNEGYKFTGWDVDSYSVFLLDTTGETSFNLGTSDITITALFEAAEMDWVQIGSTKWAKYNVAAPGTFTANPEDRGMFYQHGQTVGWDGTTPSPADGLFYQHDKAPLGWGDISNPINTPYGQGPCPAGYTVPTTAQATELFSATQTVETINGMQGKRFASSTGESVFIPFAESNQGFAPAPAPVTSNVAFLWLDDAPEWNGVLQGPPPFGMFMNLTPSTGANGNSISQIPRPFGMSIRCVLAE